MDLILARHCAAALYPQLLLLFQPGNVQFKKNSFETEEVKMDQPMLN